MAALTGLGAYSGWVTRQYIAHLLADIAGLSRTAHRGTDLAEKATRKLSE